MHSKVHHKAIVISAVFTAFLLAGAVGGLFIVNRLSVTTADASSAEAVVVQPPAVQVVDNAAEQSNAALDQANAALQQAAADLAGKDAVIAAYDTQLRQAYAALQQAYGQIDQLQAAQNQPGLSRGQEHEQSEHSILSSNQGDFHND